VDNLKYSDDDIEPEDETKTVLSSIRSLPERYKTREHDSKRILICLETPNIQVRIEPGLTFPSSAVRKSPPGTIYLDGVAQSEPLMDLEKQIYNFDHHEGCIRPFTLSTCEQVLVMILKGMDLRGKDWRVLANEPDLDTILAIWLIFNHVRIQQKEFGGLNRLCALVRLEGIIDSHGLEMASFSGFAPKLLTKTKKMIEYLRAEEVDLKSKGVWKETDFLGYAALILHKVDRIIYKSEELDDVKDVKELARIEFGDNRIAVVVETQLGIYELESYLNRLYGERLGLVILKKDERTYTLRRLDPFMAGDLNAVYRILNFIDPAVRGCAEGNKWGGSADIGGSPRGDGGTKLTPPQIAKACRDAFEKPRPGRNVIRFIHSLILTGFIIGLSAVCASLPFFRSWLESTSTGDLVAKTYFAFLATMLFFTLVCLGIYAHKRPWQFGFALPSGRSWWIWLPFVLLSVTSIGIYFPYKGIKAISHFEIIIYLVVLVPLSSELLFRGLVHGILINPHNVRSRDRRSYFSFPAIASAFLYAAFLTGTLLYQNYLQNGFQAISTIECLFAALVIGLSTAFVRERSQSIFPSVLFHAMGMAFLTVYYSRAAFPKIWSLLTLPIGY
jgi:hypothetical protein